ncbi:MAG TPA: hypothetical protein VEQ60_28370 [Longimicrobium sp.]|nr:hypothetical protein [Longimicrobium sp.]
MEWTVDFERPEKYVVVTTRGLLSPEDHRRMTEDVVSRAEWRPGMTVLFDHRRLDFGDSGLEAMQRAVENDRENDDSIGDGKAAVLMNTPVNFVRGRQFQLLTEGRVGARLQIFLNEAEAIRWLLEE